MKACAKIKKGFQSMQMMYIGLQYIHMKSVYLYKCILYIYIHFHLECEKNRGVGICVIGEYENFVNNDVKMFLKKLCL